MLDIKILRSDIDNIAVKLKTRGYNLDVKTFVSLENKRKKLQVETQDLQNEKNVKSKSIGAAKAKGEDIKPFLDEVAKMGDALKQNEHNLSDLQKDIEQFLMAIPNVPHKTVPTGLTEDDNVEMETWGDKPVQDFDVLDHVDLGSELMDFASASKLSGARFVVLRSHLAKMHRALIQLMLDTHTNEHNYNEVYVPYIVNRESLEGTGQLPKFEEDLFKIGSEHDLYLIPTAEVPVTNLVRDSIIEEDDLPLKFVAHTPCFRSEAGAYGKDTRGLIRQHQFEKVELVQIVKPEDSEQAFEELTQHAETILKKLKLPYRKLNLCAGDIGFSAARTYDLEVWVPAQNTYREISSCSHFEDFQARRMQARFRRKGVKKPELLHTVNGSGLAVGRTLVAIMENYQQADGSINVPEVLQPYMGGISNINAA